MPKSILRKFAKIWIKNLLFYTKNQAFTYAEEKRAPEIYRKFNDKSLSHKISVYSESQKNFD